MFHKSEIVLMKEKMQRAFTLGNEQYKEHLHTIEITFTYIYLYTKFLYRCRFEQSPLSLLSSSPITVFFVVLELLACQRMFQLLPDCFLHSVWLQILSRQCNRNYALSECPIIVFSHYSFQEYSNSFLPLLKCFRTF